MRALVLPQARRTCLPSCKRSMLWGRTTNTDTCGLQHLLPDCLSPAASQLGRRPCLQHFIDECHNIFVRFLCRRGHSSWRRYDRRRRRQPKHGWRRPLHHLHVSWPPFQPVRGAHSLVCTNRLIPRGCLSFALCQGQLSEGDSVWTTRLALGSHGAQRVPLRSAARHHDPCQRSSGCFRRCR